MWRGREGGKEGVLVRETRRRQRGPGRDIGTGDVVGVRKG